MPSMCGSENPWTFWESDELPSSSMDFAAVEEACKAVVLAGEVDDSILLSRRHRWKPLAVDVHEGLGAVLFAARGKRSGLLTSSMVFDLGETAMQRGRVCGYGRSDGEPYLPERQPMSPSGNLASRARWDRIEGMQVASWQLVGEVDVWAPHGEVRDVAGHGFVVMVWRGRRRPRVRAFGNDGQVLSRLRPG